MEARYTEWLIESLNKYPDSLGDWIDNVQADLDYEVPLDEIKSALIKNLKDYYYYDVIWEFKKLHSKSPVISEMLVDTIDDEWFLIDWGAAADFIIEKTTSSV